MKRRLVSKITECKANQDLIVYPEGVTIMIGYEFNIYNVGDKDVEIKFEEDGDILVLEPNEGFDTQFPIEHAIVLTEGAVVKYTYWV